MGSENKICFLFHSTHPRRVWRANHPSLKLSWHVSIHTPTKGVTRWRVPILPDCACFNPHTHEGCDSEQRKRCVPGDMFQSTHPRRVWPALSTKLYNKTYVSIHTPTKGVTQITKDRVYDVKFQSTHPRRVWPDRGGGRGRGGPFQSTHPRRVWLYMRKMVRVSTQVSIHTPTKGVTAEAICKHVMQYGFNPHTHEGCDKKTVAYIKNEWKVSIHTPTKGVTYNRQPTFQLTLFQSTHPRRVWHIERCFQRSIILVSIHTPTKGVTLFVFPLPHISDCFNPHTHEGCDRLVQQYPSIHRCFNPHTHEGCDSSVSWYSPRLRFQSTHPRRVWHYWLLGWQRYGVSIHTPTKGVTFPPWRLPCG